MATAERDDPKRSSRSTFRQAISAALTLAAFVFIAVTVLRVRDDAGAGDLDLVFTWHGVLVVALFVAAVVLSGLLWERLLRLLTGARFARNDAVWAHVQSWLLKYVPGQVGSVTGKVLWGAKQGVSARLIGLSFAYENIFHLVASLTVSLPVILLIAPQHWSSYAWLLALTIALQACVVLLAWLPSRIPALERRLGSSALNTGQLLRVESWYLGPRLVNAVGFALVAHAHIGLDGFRETALVGATYVLAGIIGILAFLVPSGIGVREAVITAVLAPRFGEGPALAIAVEARVYATVADVVLLGGYLATRRRVPASIPSTQESS